MGSRNLGFYGYAFVGSRALQTLSLLALIGLIAHFLSELAKVRVKAPPTLTGAIVVSCVTVLWTLLSFTAYHDTHIPYIATGIADLVFLVPFVVVAILVGIPLNDKSCSDFPKTAANNSRAGNGTSDGNFLILSLGGVGKVRFAGAEQSTCFELTAVWALFMALCVFFSISAVAALLMSSAKRRATRQARGFSDFGSGSESQIELDRKVDHYPSSDSARLQPIQGYSAGSGQIGMGYTPPSAGYTPPSATRSKALRPLQPVEYSPSEYDRPYEPSPDSAYPGRSNHSHIPNLLKYGALGIRNSIYRPQKRRAAPSPSFHGDEHFDSPVTPLSPPPSAHYRSATERAAGVKSKKSVRVKTVRDTAISDISGRESIPITFVPSPSSAPPVPPKFPSPIAEVLLKPAVYTAPGTSKKENAAGLAAGWMTDRKVKSALRTAKEERPSTRGKGSSRSRTRRPSPEPLEISKVASPQRAKVSSPARGLAMARTPVIEDAEPPTPGTPPSKPSRSQPKSRRKTILEMVEGWWDLGLVRGGTIKGKPATRRRREEEPAVPDMPAGFI